ncbi:hypothetical protein BJ912DRAFT_966295 [Pholiota molesta]|nr:hypothetical protein BJ912DRAFT_966295 [Pholiota molesta]
MASQSPQRARRPQTQQLTQGAMLNHAAREASPSPSLRERPRAVKALSMPMVPSINHFLPQPGSQDHDYQQQQQPSPTIPIPGARRSPPLGAAHSQPNVNAHYTRPSPRAPAASYPNKLHQQLEYLEMTPELLADIERADQQQYQSVQPGHPYSYNTGSRGDSPPSGKGGNNDRARGPPERTSPPNPDNGQQRGWRDQQQQQQQQQLSRDSPKARDRPAASPNVFPPAQGQGPSHTPEPPVGHVPIVIPGEPHPSSYLAQFANREQPAMRRQPNAEPRQAVSMANPTPPAQNLPTRTPDRFFPVQEEDEVTAKNNGNGHSNWQVNDQGVEQPFHSSSPTPSSDLDPDGSSQRYDTAASHNNQLEHRDEDKSPHKEDDHGQYEDRDSNEDDATFTPTSPMVALPGEDRGAYYPKQNPSPIDPTPPQPTQSSERPSQYTDPRQQPQVNTNGNQYQNYPPRQDYAYAQEPYQNGNGRYHPPQIYPDDFQSYGEDATSAYIRAYLHSPRPDAPIPPTPHSQTAAPSPSPLLSAYGIANDLPAYRMRAAAAGSPYPFPFAHVRRNRQIPGRFFPGALEQQPTVTEQVARQWQVFAQNNQGNITDSTLSPRATPLPSDLYNHWAYLHTQRTMAAAMADTASIQSSPSHQPIPLPLPPSFISSKKKDGGYQAKRHSTQPRETSPELSSSGEETSTAGEERPNSVQPDHTTSAPLPPPIVTTSATESTDVEDDAEWVDEDEDEDYEDLLDLEYHPAFVRNISKRRRKWEVGWENLIQAFQALDRQTDATMVLLASPSHTTRLHSLRSRSIRRQPLIVNSTSMSQIRAGFTHVASQRRATRPDKSSLVDRLMVSSGSSGGDGSDGSSGSAESLRRALDVALGSLGIMGEVYEQREMRVLEELQRAREERERVELLLRQVLGDKLPLNNQHLPRSAS